MYLVNVICVLKGNIYKGLLVLVVLVGVKFVLLSHAQHARIHTIINLPQMNAFRFVLQDFLEMQLLRLVINAIQLAKTV